MKPANFKHGSGARSKYPSQILNPEYITLWFGLFFFMLNLSTFNLLPYYLELRGASPGLYGSVAGILGVSNFFSLILLGHRADAWSRKRTVMFYFMFALGGNLAGLWAMEQPELEWFYGVRLLQGIFMGLGFPLVFTWVVEVTPPSQKHLALAWFGIGGILANSLGPSLGELVLSLQGKSGDASGFYLVFLMALGFQLAAMAFFLITRDVAVQRDEEGARPGLAPLLRRRETVLMLMVAWVFGGVFGVLMSFGKNYTASLGLSFVSVLLWAYSAGAVFSRIFIRQITGYLNEKRMIPLGLAGVAATFLLLSVAGNYPLLAFIGFLYGLSHGILYPTLFVRMIDMQAPEELGRAATLYQGSYSVGWGLYPLTGGFLISVWGFPVFFLLLALLASLAIPLHHQAEILAEKRRRRQDGA
ncbi:MAG: MFS transporter [bacterium]